MENYIPISYLNDFIFCPRSIYFHNLYGSRHEEVYHETFQVKGKNAHATIDENSYSSKKSILQGLAIYSEKYNLYGKIDIFDNETKTLTERKRTIKTIYDGYVFQIYAHYFALTEMGYKVKFLRLHSLTDNKNYPISFPHKNLEMLQKFENLIEQINHFNLEDSFSPLKSKCEKCIYNNLCDKSLI